MSEHQRLMDEVYDLWGSSSCKTLKQKQVLDKFSEKHQAAVMLGNLNYQVNNGGFMQWHDNGYSMFIDTIIELLSKIKRKAEDREFFDKLYSIVSYVDDILYGLKDASQCPHCGHSLPDWVKEAATDQTMRELDDCDLRYYELTDAEDQYEWLFQNWDKLFPEEKWDNTTASAT